MKFSISLPTGFEGVMYPIPFVEPGDFVRMAQLCETLGYDSVWGNDHITSQHYVRELFPDKAPNFYEVLTVLSFCAAATTRIRVGTALTVLPMRDPFWLAKQAATIDQLSNGRLVLALGVGAYREEFAAWAPRLAPKARRGEMMRLAARFFSFYPFQRKARANITKFFCCVAAGSSPFPLAIRVAAMRTARFGVVVQFENVCAIQLR